jgi:methionyl-tRNA formyltransferase
MKLCIFGNKTTTTELLSELIRSQIQVDHLVTLSIDKAEVAKISGQDSGLIEFATSHGIFVFNPDSYSLKSDKDITFFQNHHFDLGLCTGWQRIIPKPIIDSFTHGIFGWHGSGFEFPNGRGRSPLNWTLRLGMAKVYHNLFRYAYGADDGMVYETEIIKIDPNDYISNLQLKALEHIKQSSVRLVKDVARGTIQLMEQPNHPYIQFPSLDIDSGQIYPKKMGFLQSLNIIRSCSRPFPGAFVEYEGKIYRIWKARSEIIDVNNDEECVVVNDKLFVKVKDGCIISNDFEITSR